MPCTIIEARIQKVNKMVKVNIYHLTSNIAIKTKRII